MKKLLLLTALFIYCFKMGFAQPGTLDASFGKKGIVRSDFGAGIVYSSAGKQVLLLPDGSMYIVFESSGVTFITKKHSDGSADSAYGQAGFSVSVAIQNSHAALQKDGKIVVAGSVAGEFSFERNAYPNSNEDFAVARYNTDGSLDHSFNGYGQVTTDFIGHDDVINSIAIQNDGKIVVAGYTSIFDENEIYDSAEERYYYPKISDNISLARYNSNGSPDNSFDADGRLLTQLQINSSNPNSVAVQKDGKIVVAGLGKGLTLVRYNSDGSADNTFKVTDNLTKPDSSYFAARALAIQGDGKIVLGGLWQNTTGNNDFVLARFNTSGSLDKTFDTDGIQTTDFRTYNDVINSIIVQADGKIVAAGSASNGKNDAFAIARYNTNGSPDNTFDMDGKKMNFINSNNIYAVSLAVAVDGKLVAAGYEQFANIAIVRYNTNGSLDNTFDKNGSLIENFKQKNTVFTSNAVQKDGKVVAAGYAWNGAGYDNIIARYNANGIADTSFSSDGILVTATNANPFNSRVALQTDGKIVTAAGSLLVRYNTNGSLDNTFSGDGKQAANFEISVLKIQADGRIVVAGGSTIARYAANGSLDNSFNGNGMLTTDYLVKDLAFQSDGKIVVGEDSDEDAYLIIRYNINGSVDSAFNAQSPNWDPEEYYPYFNSYLSTISIQKDGKIVVAGYGGPSFRNGEEYSTLVARYNPDGSLDNTFSQDGKDIALGYSYSALVRLQDDGKIIVVSDLYTFTQYGYGIGGGFINDIPIGFGIIRYNTNGSRDSSFGVNGQIFSQQDGVIRMRSIVIANNKLYAAGNGEVRPAGPDVRSITNYGFLARFNLAANKAPIVKITSPANNAAFTAPANITVNAAASDADGTVYSVKFYNGTTYLKTDFTSPYSYTIANLPAGTYSITAKATDNAGAQTISAPVIVKVSNATIVSSKPVNNKTGIKEEISVKLSPNPATNVVNLYISGLQPNKPADISILSVSGIMLKKVQISSAAQMQIDVSSLSKGVYTIKIASREKVMLKQFVKL